MVFRMVLFVWEFLMDVMAISRLSTGEKNLELLLLRQQLRIVERTQGVDRRYRAGRRYRWRWWSSG
jgi:hypothetical protein